MVRELSGCIEEIALKETAGYEVVLACGQGVLCVVVEALWSTVTEPAMSRRVKNVMGHDPGSCVICIQFQNVMGDDPGSCLVYIQFPSDRRQPQQPQPRQQPQGEVTS